MAAEQGSSISALLAAQLEKVVRERKDYEKAKRKALARMRKGSIGATSLQLHATNFMSDKCFGSVRVVNPFLQRD